jgi:hypothetical protein
VAEAEDNNGWREAGCGGRGGGATVWRMTAAEEMQWTVGGRGTTTALTAATKKQQSTNDWWQRWRTTTAGERWGAVVEMEEQLLCSGGGFTIRSWRMEAEDGQAGEFIFSFLGGVESYLESYLANPNTNMR